MQLLLCLRYVSHYFILHLFYYNNIADLCGGGGVPVIQLAAGGGAVPASDPPSALSLGCQGIKRKRSSDRADEAAAANAKKLKYYGNGNHFGPNTIFSRCWRDLPTDLVDHILSLLPRNKQVAINHQAYLNCWSESYKKMASMLCRTDAFQLKLRHGMRLPRMVHHPFVVKYTFRMAMQAYNGVPVKLKSLRDLVGMTPKTFFPLLGRPPHNNPLCKYNRDLDDHPEKAGKSWVHNRPRIVGVTEADERAHLNYSFTNTDAAFVTSTGLLTLFNHLIQTNKIDGFMKTHLLEELKKRCIMFGMSDKFIQLLIKDGMLTYKGVKTSTEPDYSVRDYMNGDGEVEAVTDTCYTHYCRYYTAMGEKSTGERFERINRGHRLLTASRYCTYIMDTVMVDHIKQVMEMHHVTETIAAFRTYIATGDLSGDTFENLCTRVCNDYTSRR